MRRTNIYPSDKSSHGCSLNSAEGDTLADWLDAAALQLPLRRREWRRGAILRVNVLPLLVYGYCDLYDPDKILVE